MKDNSLPEELQRVHMVGIGGAGMSGIARILQERERVRAAIKRIRRKFCDLDPRFDALKNYPGFGYRWVSQDGQR